MNNEKPSTVFHPLLQHERTALAWERTAIATMVTGLLFVRTVTRWYSPVAVIGLAQVLFGAGLLIWAGRHYESLHGPLRAGESPVHPAAARVVGVTTAVFTGLATVIAAVAILTDL